MLRFFDISSSRSQLTMTHKVHVASFIAPGGSIIFRPRNVALENFFFCFGFKTQQRAFLGYLYVLFLELHVLWTSGVPVLAWCVVLAHVRSLWVGLVAPSQCHPVWTGSALAPGAARPDFTLRSTFTDLFLPMPC